MGVYYNTFIVHADGDRKQLATIDTLIEEHEWTREYVSASELGPWMKRRRIDWKWPLEECKLEEVCMSTLSVPVTVITRRINIV